MNCLVNFCCTTKATSAMSTEIQRNMAFIYKFHTYVNSCILFTWINSFYYSTDICLHKNSAVVQGSHYPVLVRYHRSGSWTTWYEISGNLFPKIFLRKPWIMFNGILSFWFRLKIAQLFYSELHHPNIFVEQYFTM